MQHAQVTQPQAVQELYTLTANLLVHENKKTEEVKTALVERGLSDDAAYTIIRNVQDELKNAKREDARKDMIYGALWCIGGTVATLANVGFIFWGAILFGGVQFVKGLINHYKE